MWTTVSMGYQPEMTRAWFAALYTFYEEAKPDRVFTNSVVLGGHADQRLLLLNGPQRNAARGRGPQAGRSEEPDEEAGDGRLVRLPAGPADGVRAGLQAEQGTRRRSRTRTGRRWSTVFGRERAVDLIWYVVVVQLHDPRRRRLPACRWRTENVFTPPAKDGGKKRARRTAWRKRAESLAPPRLGPLTPGRSP